MRIYREMCIRTGELQGDMIALSGESSRRTTCKFGVCGRFLISWISAYGNEGMDWKMQTIIKCLGFWV